MIDIHRQHNPIELAQTTVQALSDALSVGTENGILLLLSGGSVLALVQNMKVPNLIDLTVGMIDERYDIDPAINNFLLLKQTQLYQDAVGAGVSMIESIPLPEESLEDFSQRVSLQWEAWLATHPKGKVVAMLGVGPDGHTAGVFPFPEDPVLFETLFIQTPHALVGYDSRQKNIYPKRVTATLAFLKHRVDEVVVYISGTAKETALQDILKDEGELCQTPARIVREMKHVQLFTDII